MIHTQLKSEDFSHLIANIHDRGGMLDLSKAGKLVTKLQEWGKSSLTETDEDSDFFGIEVADWASMREVTMISFTGGGSEYTYEFVGTTTMAYAWEIEDESTWDVLNDAEFEAEYVGFGAKAESKMKNSWMLTRGMSQENEKAKRTVVSYTLADPDPNDEFDVQILMDPVYGTPIFRTISGISKCIWEPNTMNREMPVVTLEGTKNFHLGFGGDTDKVAPDETIYRYFI